MGSMTWSAVAAASRSFAMAAFDALQRRCSNSSTEETNAHGTPIRSPDTPCVADPAETTAGQAIGAGRVLRVVGRRRLRRDRTVLDRSGLKDRCLIQRPGAAEGRRGKRHVVLH